MARKPRVKSKGTCMLCNSTFDKSAMKKHLQSCMGKSQIEEKSLEKAKTPPIFYHVLVEGHDLPEYWMHLKVSGNASFRVLDSFFRRTWLECCGHMSAFSIGRDEVSMSRRFQDILYPGMKLIHEYDFGSTTELLLTVISEFEAGMGKKKVEILARNDPMQIKCSHCENLATRICTECMYGEGGWLCDDCAEDHECGEDMLLPVVNSPRTGVCGYVG
jgi:hypothetical protein